MNNIDEAIINLIKNNSIQNQHELIEMLAKQKIFLNQSTISRKLKKLNIQKSDMKNQPKKFQIIENVKNNEVKQFILEIKSNEYLIVIKTQAGCANAVAEIIDEAVLNQLLGTIAGDNTIFITPKEISKIKVLLAEIKNLF